MKKISVLFFLLVIVFACHRKTVAESDIILSNKKTKSDEKKTATVSLHANASEAAKLGSVVYTNRCGRCHDLKPAGKYTSVEWENILKSMIPKAKLNEAAAKQVTAYVMEHAKK